MKQNILMTAPNLKGTGGVTHYYKATLPYLKLLVPHIAVLQIGRWGHNKNILKPLQDQFSFRQCCKQHPDLVHINPSLGSKSFWRDGLFAWQAAQKQIPLLVFFRGWDHSFAKTVEEKYLFFFKKTFARADAFIVLASDFKETLRSWGITAPIYIETTTVDEELLKNYSLPERIIADIQTETIKILFLSRLERGKGVFKTIEAIHILRKQGVQISLSIAGDGSVKLEAEQLVDKLQLTDAVSFLGYVRDEEKINAFKQHDIFCFPSEYGEGLPNAVLEAMAFGLPVITTSVGGLKDIFQDQKMGFLLDDPKPQSIADKLQKLINTPDRIRQMSAYNYQYAQEHFMASRVAERLVAIYEETILHSQ